LSSSEEKLKQIAKDAGVDENHKLVAGLLRQIELKKAAILKKQGSGEGAAGGITFEKDIAPIIVARCLRCHGDDNPRGGLQMDTFGGIVAGCGGKLVVPGNAGASMLVQRIMA